MLFVVVQRMSCDRSEALEGTGWLFYLFWGALWNTGEDIVLGRNPYFKRAEFHTPLFSPQQNPP